MKRNDYETFLASKAIVAESKGIQPKEPHEILFPFQRDIVKWALRLGRACIWANCGLGKTFMQLEWAKQIPGRVLIVAPLNVVRQTIAESRKLDMEPIDFGRSPDAVKTRIGITNYENVEKFACEDYEGVVGDETSCLKSFTTATRNTMIQQFQSTPYRLACTATPAPNDHVELGNHAEFVGAMTRTEMLSMFFVHDGGDTSKWRLKGHAATDFWKWICSWAVMLNKPSDLGYQDDGFILPALNMVEHVIETSRPMEGYLLPMPASSLKERRLARKSSVEDRCGFVFSLLDGLNLQSEVLQKQSTEGEGKKQRLVLQQLQNRPLQAPPKEIHDGLLQSQSDQVEEKPEATGHNKHKAKGKIRQGPSLSRGVKGAKSKLAEKVSGEEAQSETCGEVWNNNGTNAGSSEIAGEQMRDLRIQGKEPAEVLSNGGSLSSIQEGPRHSVRELQSCNRTPEGQPSAGNEASGISKEKWLIWCELNSEQDKLEEMIGDSCVSIRGTTGEDERIQEEEKWRLGDIPVLISKPSIFGFGMNWQHCPNVAFVGLSDSYEAFYQAIRRCWRFGQTKPVHAHIIISDMEGAVLKNIKRKEADAERMANEMVKHMHSINEANLKGTIRKVDTYAEDIATGKNWTVYLGDCVDVARKIESDSVGFSIFSPPFESLYTYSASDRDMGNCQDSETFAVHFQYLVEELFRVMQPGRLVSFHCMNLPTSKTKHGYIGIRDFRGELIRAFEAEGFIFHSEVCIWKDPVTAMQRTKALGLLHKQMVKDSCMSRQGIPDYLVTMRKPGENQNRVEGELDRWIGDDSFKSKGRLSIDLWQRYASPVWMDINPSRTLQKESAREEKDERHIAPLQIDVIERAMELWSNPGDLVLSPFAGIGSEGYVAVKTGRRFIGIELKKSYWTQGVANLKAAETQKADDLFAKAEPEAVGTTGE